MNRGFKAFIETISWAAFYAFAGVWVLFTTLIAWEEVGILHFHGRFPITDYALNDPRIFWLLFALGPVYSAWWAVHIYRRRWGDLSKYYELAGRQNK